MKIIDGGKAFDWGRTSSDYAKFRDIYPQEFYDKILERNLCTAGQDVLDLGTGTGVIPRNMYQYGANWTGADISVNQIEKAKELSKDMDINYLVSPAEELKLPECSFDVITACQCFEYFSHEKMASVVHRLLKADGSFVVLYMAWLPFEDRIAGESEKLVLKYNPQWSGAGMQRGSINVPECYLANFDAVYREDYAVNVHFTRESWHGRIKACRGIGASLTENEINLWEEEHKDLLGKLAPEEFDVLHYASIVQLKKK